MENMAAQRLLFLTYLAKAGSPMRVENPRRPTDCGGVLWDARFIPLPQAGQKLALSDICVPQFAQYISRSSFRVFVCQGSRMA